MVEINNQCKAFLDMLAWSEGTITTVRKPEIMVTAIAESYLLDYSDHPRKLVTLNSKIQINRRQHRQEASFLLWMPTASRLA